MEQTKDSLNFTIGRLQLEDITSLAPLLGQLGYECHLEDLQKRFFRLEESFDHTLLIVRGGESILGFAHICRDIDSLLSEPRANLVALIVDESVRGSGIGATLLAACEQWAYSHKLNKIRVGTNTLRERAHKFYANNGYSIAKSHHLFEKRL